MSITDELREYAGRLSDEAARKSEHGFSPVAMALEGIADRIDVEHEAACAEAYGNGVESVALPDMTAYVKLPVDANGEYIQPSDIPYLTKTNDGKRLAFCPSLELRQDGTWRLAGWTLDRYRILKPTVENVLREFAEKVTDSQVPGVHPTYEEAIAEYAQRLALVEDWL